MARQSHRRPACPHWNSPKGQCRWCGNEILDSKGKAVIRRHWHPECVEAYLLATNSTTQRRAVFERDKGICARCGRDAEKWGKEPYNFKGQRGLDDWLLKREFERLFGHSWSDESRKWKWQQEREIWIERGWPKSGVAAWQADHIRPLIEADGRLEFFTLENLQTLCHKCHVVKGCEDRARQKAARSIPTVQLSLI